MAHPRSTNGRSAPAGPTRSSFSPGGARQRAPRSPVQLSQPLVDAEHVARLLCVKRKRVYELARRSNDPLPSVRLGGAVRFALSQVEDWVTAQAPA